MGCNLSSSAVATNEPVVSRAAAQSFFNLDGLPLSLTVVPVDKRSLQLRVVGLDCVEEMMLLEAAFQKRDLALRSAVLLKIGAHIDQTFELVSLRKNSPVKAFMSPSRPKANEVKLESVSAETARNEVPLATAAIKGVQTNDLMKLTINCTVKGGERGVVAETMRKVKHHLVCATLKTEVTGEASDMYWMARDANTEERSREDLLSEFRFALFDQVQKLNSLAQVKKKKQFESPVRGGASGIIGAEPEEQMGKMESVAVVDQINARRRVQEIVLPICLKEKQRDLEYQIHPSDIGLVVNGFQKYAGIGLVQRSLRAMLGYKDATPETSTLQLEMRTFFVPERQAQQSQGHLAKLSHFVTTATGKEEYAHFVTWLDISARTWTIDRCFLNGVLPGGKGYGAKAIAEHLLAPPELFFPKDQESDGSVPQWMGSFMDSAPDLEKLVVSDIVNWNTYMLMAVVGCRDKGKSADALVGDVLDIALQTELTHAKLTKDQLYKTCTALQVFQRTVLGKTCVSVLKQWNTKLKRKITMQSAEVVFGEGDEQIFGQRRPRIACIVTLAEEADSERDGLARMKNRLSMASEKLTKPEDHVHIVNGNDGVELTAVTGMVPSPTRSPNRIEVPKQDGFHSSGSIGLQGSLGTKNNQSTTSLNSMLNPLGSLKLVPSMTSLQEADKEEQMALAENAVTTSQEQSVTWEHMGQNLHKSFADGPAMTAKKSLMKAEDRSPGSPEIFEKVVTSGKLYFVGLSSAMTCLLHELQCERGLSCRAAAAAATDSGSASALSIAKERLRMQRLNTDKAVGQLLDLLKLASALMETGTLQYRHKAVLDLQQQVSIATMVQRSLVDDALATGIDGWLPRYLLVCTTGETGYHVVIGKLLRGLLKALQFASEGQPDANIKVGRCALLLRCKEQVGQERAFLAAKASSRWVETEKHREMFDAVRKGSKKLERVLALDDFEWNSPIDKLSVVNALSEMYEGFEKEVQDSSYSIPEPQGITWWDTYTDWIDAAYDQIQEDIEVLSDSLPEAEAVAQPGPRVELRAAHNTGLGMDAGDEDAQLLVSELRKGKFSRIVIMAGAGISVSANLPDFRSPGGLYDQLRKTTNITAPETIFTGEFLKNNPELFFEVVQKLRTDHVKPTLTHCFIKLLHDRKLLKRCYTQNIDCLERKAGIPPDLLAECHGTTASARCHVCQKPFDKDYFFDWDASKNTSKVPTCDACRGLVRPNIVLFGESLAGGFQEKCNDDFRDTDLLIIMGTSLQVQPFASLPKLVKANCAVLVINREMPSSLQLHRQVRTFRSRLGGAKLRKEVFLQGDCDTSIRWLCKEIGWADDLEALFANRS